MRLSEQQIQTLQQKIQGRRVLIEYPPEHDGGTGYHASDANQHFHQAILDLQQTRQDLRELYLSMEAVGEMGNEALLKNRGLIKARAREINHKYGWEGRTE